MDLYLKYKHHFISELGKGPLTDDVIDRVGKREFGSKWGGAVSQDDFKVRPDTYNIVNTCHRYGKGSHWCAIYVGKGNSIYIFDTFGRSSTKLLHNIAKLKATFIENKRVHQRDTSLCGQMSLAWLCCVRDIGLINSLRI